MNIDTQYLEKISKEVFSIFSKYLKSVDFLKKNFEEAKNSIDPERINYCLEKFLQAEFDYNTPGDRGLGRMTDYVPRLGAYFRKSLSKLPLDKIKELDFLLTGLIVKSYLYQVIVPEPVIKKSKMETGEQLYQRWIPEIYVYDLGQLSESFRGLLEAVVDSDIANVKHFFKMNELTSGFFSKNKTDDILFGYINAGLVLRLAEAHEKH